MKPTVSDRRIFFLDLGKTTVRVVVVRVVNRLGDISFVSEVSLLNSVVFPLLV